MTKDIDASVKTIYNDIMRLRYDFGVPVEYNASKWGYYITKPEFEPYELRLMVDSIQASKFITQTEARTISQKISKLADVYTKESLSRNAYVTDRVRSMNDSVVKDADRIHQAIAENRKIGFRYFHYTPSKNKPKQYSKLAGAAVLLRCPIKSSGLRFSSILSTAATRSPRCICHRQRSGRSPNFHWLRQSKSVPANKKSAIPMNCTPFVRQV